MGHALTRRPYLLVGFFHMLIGLFLFAAGAVWLLMTFFYWPQHRNDVDNSPNWNTTQFLQNYGWGKVPPEHQAWMWIVYTANIWSGFWIMLSGSFAMCVKDQGKLERFFCFMNIFSMVIFAPAAIILSLEIFFNVTINGSGPSLEVYSFIYSQHRDGRDIFVDLSLNSTAYTWILAFPIAGLSLGFIELVLSMVSCSVWVCCRPTRSYAY